MSLTHITDGWLSPTTIVEIPSFVGSIDSPDGTRALYDEAPNIPCGLMALDPETDPPLVPKALEASGALSGAPAVPCGTQATDPTIEPPGVPKILLADGTAAAPPAVPGAPEASED